MAEEEITSFISDKIPSFSLAGMGNIIIWIIGALLFIGLAVFLTYLFAMNLKYNKKIVLFRKVGNKIIPVMVDKGTFERVGTAGDYWCRTKKMKKILPRPIIQMGRNEFWFYEREDGEWINIGLKDFDEQMKKAGVYYVEEDMRLSRLGIQKNLRERFQKPSFWQKYGGLIMNVIFMLVMTVCLVILFKEMKDNWAVGKAMAEAVRDMAQQVENMGRRIGSGTQPINEFIPLLFLWRKRK